MHTPSSLASLNVRLGAGAAAAAAQTDAGRAGAGSMIDSSGSPRAGWMQVQGPKGR